MFGRGVLMGAAATFAASAIGCIGAAEARADGSFVLTARSYTASSYAPTFTGNGFIGVRVPPAGEGYAGGTVPAQSELAGFYAVPTHPSSISEGVQQRASIPSWSTLLFGDRADTYSLTSGRVTGWSQSIDLRDGVISTLGTWTAPDGHAARFAYEVFTDRADAHLGVVSLTLTPLYSGSMTVDDEIDGTGATLTDPVSTSSAPQTDQITDEVATQTTHIDAAIASQLAVSADVTASTPTATDTGASQSIGQQISFPVISGDSYTVTKFVGVDDSQDTADPVTAAQSEAAAAVHAGLLDISAENDAAWAQLWTGRIDVSGNASLASDVNASEFYLWSNTRVGEPWSISPAGLSSNGYDGHIFWDAETWMYPALLAQHPDLAAEMNDYRYDRLGAAEKHASATGYAGARFPWESALDGTEQIPPPTSINSEGLYEQHITADIALAQWQYYEVTGDRHWLSTQGYPVLSGAADFWASKATAVPGGRMVIDHVTGPDEENPDVNGEAYTTVAARTTLDDAISAAHALGVTPPARWARVAGRLSIPVARRDGLTYVPEFSGYAGQLVKQADVTLLQYPWRAPLSRSVEVGDLGYYVPRTDPGGPSMSDAVNEIDTSALRTPGCASYVYTERSVLPFIRDPFDQFSETRYGGAFTFMTGIGGFLQEFLYGYTGLRWNPNGISFAPSLNREIGAITLHDLHYHGTTFTITVGARRSTLTVLSGGPLEVDGRRVARSLTVATARPDLTPTTDLARCVSATASSSEPGAAPLAAVDGSTATGWQPTQIPATLTLALGATRTLSSATIDWGRLWPSVLTPNVAPKPGPVKTLRATRYLVQVSDTGRAWRTVATVATRSARTEDLLRFAPVRARYVRVILLSRSVAPLKATKNDANPPLTTPILDELTLPAP